MNRHRPRRTTSNVLRGPSSFRLRQLLTWCGLGETQSLNEVSRNQAGVTGRVRDSGKEIDSRLH